MALLREGITQFDGENHKYYTHWMAVFIGEGPHFICNDLILGVQNIVETVLLYLMGFFAIQCSGMLGHFFLRPLLAANTSG